MFVAVEAGGGVGEAGGGGGFCSRVAVEALHGGFGGVCVGLMVKGDGARCGDRTWGVGVVVEQDAGEHPRCAKEAEGVHDAT